MSPATAIRGVLYDKQKGFGKESVAEHFHNSFFSSQLFSTVSHHAVSRPVFNKSIVSCFMPWVKNKKYYKVITQLYINNGSIAQIQQVVINFSVSVFVA